MWKQKETYEYLDNRNFVIFFGTNAFFVRQIGYKHYALNPTGRLFSSCVVGKCQDFYRGSLSSIPTKLEQVSEFKASNRRVEGLGSRL